MIRARNFLFGWITLVMTMTQVLGQTTVFQIGDLSEENNYMLLLEGTWEFYPNELLESSAEFNADQAIPFEAPDTWNAVDTGNGPMGGMGYGTFRTFFEDPGTYSISLRVRNLFSACKVFVDDSLVCEIGRVSAVEKDYVGAWKEALIQLPLKKGKRSIVVQVCNFSHRKGGFNKAFVLGRTNEMIFDNNLKYALDAFQSGSYIIIGLFFLALYFIRRKDDYILYFALIIIGLSYRPVGSDNYLITEIFPSFPFWLAVRLEYLSMIVPLFFASLFIDKLLPGRVPRWVVLTFLVLFGIQALIVLFTPIYVFTYLVYTNLMLLLSSILVYTFIFLKAAIDREQGSIFIFISFLSMSASMTLEILVYLEVIHAVPIIAVLLQILFVFSLAMILGVRFAMSFNNVEILQRQTKEQNQQLETSNTQIIEQKAEIEKQNDNIYSSIKYARHIQESILPSQRNLEQAFKDHFVIYNPKESVGGDFYWVSDKAGMLTVAGADCTGHGVPGGFLSMISIGLLNQVVNEKGVRDPGWILNTMSLGIRKTLRQETTDNRDGLDIGILNLDRKNKKLEFGGARMRLWAFTKENEFEEIKADLRNIGGNVFTKDFRFQTIELDMNKYKTFYFMSDGYQDQFGGENRKKFSKRKLKELLISAQSKSLEEQKSLLESTMEQWKGTREQIDDIMILGFQL